MTKLFPAYMTWSMLIALQPSFYPTEAEEKGRIIVLQRSTNFGIVIFC